MLLRSLLSLVFLFHLSACGVIFDKSKRTFDDEKAFNEAFNNSSVACEIPDQCPQYTAGLYIKTQDSRFGLSACSATLFVSDMVLTNTHCLPDDIRYEGASCEGRIKINLPATQGVPAERFDCDHVVAASEQAQYKNNIKSEVTPDYAILKLKGSSQRTTPKINISGIPENSKLTLHQVDFDLHTFVVSTGVIKKNECQGNTDYAFSDRSAGPLSVIFTMSDCTRKVIHGNSGTGVINSKGEMVGVMSYIMEVEDSDSWTSIILRRSHPELWQNSGGGTNLLCVPYFNSEQPKDCYFDSSDAGSYFQLARLYTESNQRHKYIRSQKSGKKSGRESSPRLSNFLNFSSDLDLDIEESEESSVESTTDPYKSIKKNVVSKAVEAGIEMLPTCVVPSAPVEFTTTMPTYEYGRKANDFIEKSLRKKYQVRQNTSEVLFKKVSPGHYVMTRPSTSSWLQWMSGEIAQLYDEYPYEIPVCVGQI